MRRLLLLFAAMAVMAAVMAVMAVPVFAAANPERAAQQAQITSNFPKQGALGEAASFYCNKNSGELQAQERGCGDEVSARGNYGDTQQP